MLWCWLGFEGSFFEIFGSLDVRDSSENFTRLTDRLWQLIRRELACCQFQIETGVLSRVRDREKKIRISNVKTKFQQTKNEFQQANALKRSKGFEDVEFCYISECGVVQKDGNLVDLILEKSCRTYLHDVFSNFVTSSLRDLKSSRSKK